MRWLTTIAGFTLAITPAALADDAPTAKLDEASRTSAEDLANEIERLEALRERARLGEKLDIKIGTKSRVARHERMQKLLAEEKARILELEDSIRITRERRRDVGESSTDTESTDRGAHLSDGADKSETPAVASRAELDRMSPESLARLADLRFRAGQIATALDAYERLIKRDASPTWPRYQRARCLERLSRTTEAHEAYEALIQSDAKDFWAKRAEWNLRFLSTKTNEGGAK